jgi:Kdo2-lipid IVA lauroyltransferase/acyltransferase
MADVKPRLSHWPLYVTARAILWVLRLLPFSVARSLGRGLGRLGMALGIRRTVVERQIAGAFPELDQREVGALVRDAYAHFGELLIESALIPTLGRKGVLDLFTSADGFDQIEAAHRAGNGIILITGHFGNWELAGAYVAARGVYTEGIVRRLNNPLFDAFVSRTRISWGMNVVYDQDAVRRTPRAFKEGHAMCFVADQGVLGLASTFVPFFGRPAKTPRGPAVFAVKYRLPTFFVAAVRESNGKYRCIITPVEIPDSGEREENVDTMVARFTAILESWVRKYPSQYFWHHRRWKRQPPDTPAELRDPVANWGQTPISARVSAEDPRLAKSGSDPSYDR